jgi:hypothetical protein
MLPATTGLSDPMRYDFGVSGFWSTVKYPPGAQNGLVSGSIDKKKVALLPEFVRHSSHYLQADRIRCGGRPSCAKVAPNLQLKPRNARSASPRLVE